MPVQKKIDTHRVLISSIRILNKKNSLSLGRELLSTTKKQKDFVLKLSGEISELKIKNPSKEEKTILKSLKELKAILNSYNSNLDEQINAIDSYNPPLLKEKLVREKQILSSAYIITNELKSTKAGFLANKKLNLKNIASKSSIAMAAVAIELLNINKLLNKNQLKAIDRNLSQMKAYLSSMR